MSLIGMEDNNGRLSPENELTQYFLLYRTDDLIDSFESKKINIYICTPFERTWFYTNKSRCSSAG